MKLSLMKQEDILETLRKGLQNIIQVKEPYNEIVVFLARSFDAILEGYQNYVLLYNSLASHCGYLLTHNDLPHLLTYLPYLLK